MNINMILMSLLEKDVIGYSNINIYEYKYILFIYIYFIPILRKSSRSHHFLPRNCMCLLLR